jgi:tetratricopeptide (TPR) repeat protein
MMRVRFPILAILFLLTLSSVSVPAQSAEDFYNQGTKLLGERKYEEAIKAFRASLQLNSGNPGALSNIGISLVALDRMGDSVDVFRQAVKGDPRNAVIRRHFCQSLVWTKQAAEALTECNEAARLDQNSTKARVVQIEAMLLAEQPREQIINTVELALAKFPEDELVLASAAKTYLTLGFGERAAELYERAAVKNSREAAYPAALADIYLRLERDSDAIQAGRRATALDPNNADAHYYIGRLYLELGQNAEAAAEFQRVAELKPNFHEGLFLLGDAAKLYVEMLHAVDAGEAKKLSRLIKMIGGV